MLFSIDIASTEQDIADARALFEEYHAWLGDVVCARHLAEETAALPGPYAAPAGCLLLARDANGRGSGVVAVRPHEAGGAEMKRLYVRPEARGAGLGGRLAGEAVRIAKELGYRRVLATTLPEVMRGALRMYEAMGFVRTAPFADHSHVSEGVEMAYLELRFEEANGSGVTAAQPI